MTVEVNPSARIQARGVANLQHPGCCAVCGSGDADRTYVDPAVFVDFEGQFYFCNICTEEMGATIGMLSADETQFLVEQNNKFQARFVELEHVKEEYDRLVVALSSVPALRDSLSPVSSRDLVSDTDAQEQHGDPLTNDQSTIDGTAEFTESVKSVASRSEPLGITRTPSGDSDSGFTL